MRYSYEFKIECVEKYNKGQYPKTPEGVGKVQFHKTIREWVRLSEQGGYEALKIKSKPREWTAEEKITLINAVLAGESVREISIKANLEHSLLLSWIKKYRMEGYEGLASMKKGRPPKEISMPKKKVAPAELTETEREELIRLRAETEYLKAENEAIKKSIALRREKWAAQLKAKKQRLSKNSEKKDTD